MPTYTSATGYQRAQELIAECIENKMTTLDLGNLSLRDVPSSLATCVWLERLNLGNYFYYDEEQEEWVRGEGNPQSRNQLTSIPTSLTPLTQLVALSLNGNAVETIEGLTHLTKLQSLNLSANCIHNIQGLNTLTELKTLDISSNQIQHIQGLDTLQALRRLNLRFNRIQVIQGLDALEELQQLNLRYNQIQNIQGLDALDQLQQLYLHYNQIKDIQGLDALQRLQSLDLSSNQIQNIQGLNTLQQLQDLDLSSNQIQNIQGLGTLQQLQNLDLRFNQIQNTQGLHALPRLENLDLSSNQIQDIQGLDDLPQLRLLDLHSNQIQNIQGLDALHQLQQLYLQDNQIQRIQGLAALPQLYQLDLHQNQIENIDGLEQLHALAVLDLRDNQLVIDSLAPYDRPSWHTLAINGQIKDLPTELLSPRNTYDYTEAANCLPALRAWYAALNTELPAANRLFKVVVCGNGIVGKTTLVNRLLQLGWKQEDIRSTHGIQIVQGQPQRLLPEAPDEVQLYIWDFGGQEIYHQTHRLFLSYQAIYLVIFDAETYDAQTQQDPKTQESEASRSLAFWLSEIKARDNGSPVIVVQNKVDTAQDEIIPFHQHIPSDLLPDTQVAVSAQTGRNFTDLREALQRQITQHKAYAMPIPASWDRARTATLQLVADAQQDATGKQAKIKKVNYLETTLYPAGIRVESHQEAVLQYFHATGLIFYDPAYLEDDIILNQQWALDAIYAILERHPPAGSAVAQFHQRCRDMKGRFRAYDLPFPKDRYTEADRELFLGFMESARICFQLYTAQEEEAPLYQLVRALSLAPSDLTSDIWASKEAMAVHFRYHHRYHLHAGIIETFLIAMARHCQLYQLWRTGALVTWDQNWAWINVNYYEKEITISVAGAQREHLLSAIRNVFQRIQGANSTIDEHASIDGQQWVTLVKLQEAIDTQAQLARTIDGENIPYDGLHWALQHDPEASFAERPKVVHASVAVAPSKAALPILSKDIREHLADGDIEKALAVLREAYPQVGIALQGAFRRIRKSFLMGVMSAQEHRKENSLMTLRILSLVDELQQSGSEADYLAVADTAQRDFSVQLDRIERPIR